MIHFRDDKLIGENIDIIYSSNNQREEILLAVDKDGILINYETRYQANDGSRINALLSIIPINFNNEESNLGVITDITNYFDSILFSRISDILTEISIPTKLSVEVKISSTSSVP